MDGEIKFRKICILGSAFTTGNQGVGALTAGTIKSILHQLPEAEIILLDYSEEGVLYNIQSDHGTIPVRLINLRFSKKIYLKNNIALLILISLILKIIPSQNIRKKIISNNICLKHLSDSDIVTSIAGGDSFSDIYGLGRFFYVSLPQLLALFMGKKLVLLPQTLGPFNGKISRTIARYILNRASIVYSRDHIGLSQVKTFLEENDTQKSRFSYDVGFVVDPVKPEKMDLDGLLKKRVKDSCIIGLNVSGLLFMGGYTRKNMFGLRIDYREFIYDLIDFLIQKKNATLLLVPHVFGTSQNSESDAAICENIYNDLKPNYNNKIFLVKGNYDQNEIKYIIGLCDFFIGSRMHACIAAISQHVPTIALAYSRKFLGVIQSLGFESLVVDLRILNKDEIFNIIDKTYEHKDSLSKQLQLGMPKVKETALSLFSEIESTLLV